MSDSLPSISYECEIHIYTYNEDQDIESFTSPSIIAFYMYRIPFVKVGSYGMLTISLPYYIIMNIQKNLQLAQAGHYGKYPGAYLTFYIANTEKQDNSKYRTFEPDETSKLKLMLRILHVTYRGSPPSIFSMIVPVSLHVVPQQIHDLSLANSFYKLENKVTPTKIYNDYQQFIKERYSRTDSSFEFKTYDNHLNNFVFDNILVKCKNDIEVPNLLLKNYKLSNGVTYFFFDSMTFNAPNYGLLVNLMNPNQFQIWNIYDEDKYEMYNTIRLIRKIPLNNQLGSISPALDQTAWVMRDPQNTVYHKKRVGSRTITRFDKDVQNIPNARLLERNSVYIDIKDPHLYNIESGYTSLVYTPDDYNNATTRYQNLSNFINNTDGMHGFFRYEIMESHFDSVQFDKQYILDKEDTNARFIPISIVNVFSKLDAIKTTLRHTVHFNTIKYSN
jgi:hypothetical protein